MEGARRHRTPLRLNRKLVQVAHLQQVAPVQALAAVRVAARAADTAPVAEVAIGPEVVAEAATGPEVAEVAEVAVAAGPAVAVDAPAVSVVADREVDATAMCLGAELVASAWTRLRLLTTRTLAACESTCPSAPKSSRGARQAHALGTSVPSASR